jgi:hypothetical protein
MRARGPDLPHELYHSSPKSASKRQFVMLFDKVWNTAVISEFVFSIHEDEFLNLRQNSRPEDSSSLSLVSS